MTHCMRAQGCRDSPCLRWLAQPAALGSERRGRLMPGFYADLVVFGSGDDPDHATLGQPRQYATASSTSS